MNNKSTKKTGFVGGTAFAIIIAFAIVASFLLAKRIPTGYEGVVFSMNGGVQDNTIREG